MSQFIHDMIHMTEGEKLVHYWWIGPLVFVIYFALLFTAKVFLTIKIKLHEKKKRKSTGGKE